jgi:recombinational DNA repair protein RecT
VPCAKPGALRYVYSVLHIKGASMATFDVMSVDDVNRIRRRSKAAENGPWVTDYDEMAKKTVLRRHIKMSPMATEQLAQATALDAEDEDLSIPVSDAPPQARLQDPWATADQPAAQTPIEPLIVEAIQDAMNRAMGNGVTATEIMSVLAPFGAGETLGALAGSIQLEPGITQARQAILALMHSRDQ